MRMTEWQRMAVRLNLMTSAWGNCTEIPMLRPAMLMHPPRPVAGAAPIPDLRSECETPV